MTNNKEPNNQTTSNTNKTTTEEAISEINNYVTIGAIEALLNPETSTTWVKDEILTGLNCVEITENLAELIQEAIHLRLKTIALELMETLNTPHNKNYEHFLK